MPAFRSIKAREANFQALKQNAFFSDTLLITGTLQLDQIFSNSGVVPRASCEPQKVAWNFLGSSNETRSNKVLLKLFWKEIHLVIHIEREFCCYIHRSQKSFQFSISASLEEHFKELQKYLDSLVYNTARASIGFWGLHLPVPNVCPLPSLSNF